MRKINSIYIHCSDTPNGRDDKMEDIRGWHLAKGWSDVGYHFVIEIDGNIAKGRPVRRMGAHVKSQNPNSIGVCLVGRDEFNRNQIESLIKLINDLHEEYGRIAVLGHYESDSSKTCPNIDMPKFREEWGFHA